MKLQKKQARKIYTPRELLDFGYLATNTTRKDLSKNDPLLHPDHGKIMCGNCSRQQQEQDGDEKYIPCEQGCSEFYCSEGCKLENSDIHKNICCPELEEVREVFAVQVIEARRILEKYPNSLVPFLANGKGMVGFVTFMIGMPITPEIFLQSNIHHEHVKNMKSLLTPGQYEILASNPDKKYIMFFCTSQNHWYDVSFVNVPMDEDSLKLDEEFSQRSLDVKNPRDNSDVMDKALELMENMSIEVGRIVDQAMEEIGEKSGNK